MERRSKIKVQLSYFTRRNFASGGPGRCDWKQKSPEPDRDQGGRLSLCSKPYRCLTCLNPGRKPRGRKSPCRSIRFAIEVGVVLHTLQIITSTLFILFIGLVLAYNLRIFIIGRIAHMPIRESYGFLVIPILASLVNLILPFPYGKYMWIPIAIDPASYALMVRIARVAWVGVRGSRHES